MLGFGSHSNFAWNIQLRFIYEGRRVGVKWGGEQQAEMRLIGKHDHNLVLYKSLCVCWGFCLAGRCRHNKDD